MDVETAAGQISIKSWIKIFGAACIALVALSAAGCSTEPKVAHATPAQLAANQAMAQRADAQILASPSVPPQEKAMIRARMNEPRPARFGGPAPATNAK